MAGPSVGTRRGALDGVRILDLSRILAGPFCTQLLGDYGADVIKVERPGIGDDTRRWGPPFVPAPDGGDSDEATYYLCANRNKRSITIDISRPEGQALVRRLLPTSDVLIENYKVGTLARYGLGYDDLKGAFPRLVYCSITGFGQTGPYAGRAGYDFLAQGMGGIMSVTGEPEGMPVKVGVGIADIMTGMHAATAILAALHHRDATGEGQHIDMALLDSQISWLSYHALEYLNTGNNPERHGNAHASVVPYEVFPTADGHVIVACGNDGQFAALCRVLGRPEWAQDSRFATNPARIVNRKALIPLICDVMAGETTDHWVAALEEARVPGGPINTVDRVFADPQIRHRELVVEMDNPVAAGGTVKLVANPAKMSATPLTWRRSPPRLGADTEDVLRDELGLSEAERRALREAGVI